MENLDDGSFFQKYLYRVGEKVGFAAKLAAAPRDAGPRGIQVGDFQDRKVRLARYIQVRYEMYPFGGDSYKYSCCAVGQLLSAEGQHRAVQTLQTLLCRAVGLFRMVKTSDKSPVSENLHDPRILCQQQRGNVNRISCTSISWSQKTI